MGDCCGGCCGCDADELVGLGVVRAEGLARPEHDAAPAAGIAQRPPCSNAPQPSRQDDAAGAPSGARLRPIA